MLNVPYDGAPQRDDQTRSLAPSLDEWRGPWHSKFLPSDVFQIRVRLRSADEQDRSKTTDLHVYYAPSNVSSSRSTPSTFVSPVTRFGRIHICGSTSVSSLFLSAQDKQSTEQGPARARSPRTGRDLLLGARFRVTHHKSLDHRQGRFRASRRDRLHRTDFGRR